MSERDVRDRIDDSKAANNDAAGEPLINRVYRSPENTQGKDGKAGPFEAEAGRPNKFKDNEFGTALKEAQEQGKPIVIKVGAEWCGPCRNLDGNLKNPEVQKLLNDR